MKPMKVLEVIRQGQIGGGESHVLDLIAGFDKNEVTPIVMAYTGGHMIDSLERQGIKCYVVETSKAFDIKVFKKIEDVIRKENIQIIHAHGSRAASNLLWSAHKLKLPMMYTVHGWSFHQDQNSIIHKLRALSEKLICNLSKKVICVSESNCQSGMEAFGLNRKKCSVIENGVNLQRFNRYGTFKDIRKELGIQENEYIVGFIARITKQKAPLDFLKAIEQANRHNPSIKGLFIGEGDMDEEANQYIRTHNLERIIYRSPFRTDVPDILNAIDCYCLPSLWEGLSIALLEAMAMAKPVVVTPTDGTKEIITDRQNGWIVDFNSPDELTKAFLSLSSNPDTAAQYGENAYSLIERRFNSKRVSEEVTSIYENLLCQAKTK